MSLSPEQRLALVKRVNSLMPADFEALIFALKVPQGVIPANTAPQLNRASELLKWMEGPTGCGMDTFLRTLNSITPSNPKIPGKPRPSLEKSIQAFIINLAKWGPPGICLGLTAHALVTTGWIQVIPVLFVIICSPIWAKFIGKFLESAGKDAEELGGGLAHWLATVRRLTTIALQEQATQTWRHLTSDFEDQYYQRLIYICRNYETKGLDKERVLKLQHLFVPLKISSASLKSISPDLIQNLPQTLSKQQEIGELLSLMAWDSSFRRWAILGVPGSGKTTLMRYLTLIYASRKQRQLLHPNAPTFIPVLMYLREVREHIVRHPTLSLVDLINLWIQQLQPSHPLSPPPQWFARQLKQNHCLILLDGLDEIADETERQTVSQWVDAQLDAYPETAFILTSRPLGYQHAQLQQDVTVLEVQPFSLKQVQKFIHSWYLETEIRSQNNIYDLGVRDEAKRQADDLIRRIKDSPPLVAMAVNPLLLTMIATVHRRGSALPGKRVELYGEICQVLLEKRQRAKGIPGLLTAAQTKSVLQALALNLMRSNTRSFTLSSKVDRLLQTRLVKVSITPLTSEDFLKEMREVSALLVAKEEGVYEFAHLSFQEYLASVEISKLNQESLLIDALNDTRQLSWWAETIRLYVAQGDASGLIRAAIKASTVDTLALAVDCWEQGERVDPIVRKELETNIEEGLESTQKERFTLAAQVRLTHRLKNLLRVDETVEIDMRYVTCAEYQLFIDDQQTMQRHVQPVHWTISRFVPGTAKQSILGLNGRDAVAFCDWLTQQQLTPGFCYRLPNLSEVNDQPISTDSIGCWCQGSEGYFLGGIDVQKWDMWRTRLSNQIKLENSDRNLDSSLDSALSSSLDSALGSSLDSALDSILNLERIHHIDGTFVRNIDIAFARILDRALVCTINIAVDRDIVRNIDRTLDLYRSFDLDIDRDIALALNRDIVRDIDRARHMVHDIDLDRTRNIACNVAGDIDRAFDHAYDHSLDRTRAFDIDRARANANDCIHAIDINLVHALNFDHASNLDIARALVRTRRLIIVLCAGNQHRLLENIRQYLLSSFMLLELHINACNHMENRGNLIQQGSRDLIDKYRQLIKELTACRDKASQLYCLFSLIDLRRREKIYAWEGLRIVRERIDD